MVSRGREASENFLPALFKACARVYLRQLRLKVARAGRRAGSREKAPASALARADVLFLEGELALAVLSIVLLILGCVSRHW